MLIVNKGNFLEIIQFAAKGDSILNTNLQHSIQKSKLRKFKLQQNNKLHSKGRGSFVKKLQKVSETNTKWWTRHKSFEWIFKGNNCLFPTVISALYHVKTDDSLDNEIASEAGS